MIIWPWFLSPYLAVSVFMLVAFCKVEIFLDQYFLQSKVYRKSKLIAVFCYNYTAIVAFMFKTYCPFTVLNRFM